jgi:dimethylaniline monooxygenase (N-oxide forming)
VLWFLTGTQAGCNQWVGELPNERLGRVRRPFLAVDQARRGRMLSYRFFALSQAYVFLNKSHKAMHFIKFVLLPNCHSPWPRDRFPCRC